MQSLRVCAASVWMTEFKWRGHAELHIVPHSLNQVGFISCAHCVWGKEQVDSAPQAKEKETIPTHHTYVKDMENSLLISRPA